MVESSATRAQTPYTGIAVAAPVTVDYSRYSNRSAHWFLARVLRRLLDESGIDKDDVDGLCVSSFQLVPDTAVGLTQHLGVSPRWLDHIPMGGACGVVALRRAARAVQCGDAEVVACLAGDTNHVDTFRRMLGSFSQYAQDAVYPYGSGGPNANFAFLTDHYMREYGATREDFGKLCVAQRTNALANPVALFKKPLTMDEYLNARVITAPLHLFDLRDALRGRRGLSGDHAERAEALGLPHARVLRHHRAPQRLAGRPDPDARRLGHGRGLALCKRRVGAGRYRLSVHLRRLSGHQRAAIREPRLLQRRRSAGVHPRPRLRLERRLPLNPSGGQLSVGQAGAAGGYLGLVEAVRQLTGTALGHQVDGAGVGLVSGFGMINYDRGLCSAAAILAERG